VLTIPSRSSFYPRARSHARQFQPFHCKRTTYPPLCMLNFRLPNPKTLSPKFLDGNLDLLAIHRCRRRLSRCRQPQSTSRKSLLAWLRNHHRLGCSCKAAGNQLVLPCLNAGHPPHSQSTTEGSTVAVFGCGAIGLGVINTSALVSASRIIAIDTNPGKEDWAKKFGATDFVNPTKLKEGQRIQDYLVEITDGGLDYTFDCTGNVRCPSCTEYKI